MAKPDIRESPRFPGILVDGFRPHFFSGAEFTAIADDHSVVLRQSCEYFDSIAGFSSQLHLPLFDASLGIHDQNSAAGTVPLQSLNRNRERIVLLLQDDLRLGIHALLESAVGVLHIDLGMHGPGFVIERVRKASDAAFEIPVHRGNMNLHRASQLELRYG